MRDRQPWSAEDDALLNSLAGDGLSARQIATRMGRSRHSVIGRSHRIGGGVAGRKPVRSVQLTGRLHRRTLVTFAPEPPKAPPEGSKTIVDLGVCDCRWPFGDPRDLSTFRYCGQDTGDIGRSYCHAHAMVAAAR